MNASIWLGDFTFSLFFIGHTFWPFVWDAFHFGIKAGSNMPEQSLIINEINETSEANTENNAKDVVQKEETTTESKETTQVESSPTETKPTSSYDLNKFQLQRILNNNTRNKSIALLGSFPSVSETDSAIVILEKQAFRETDVSTGNTAESKDKVGESENGIKDEEVHGRVSYFGNDLKVQTHFINNVYGSYQCTPPAELNGKICAHLLDILVYLMCFIIYNIFYCLLP